MARPGRRFLRNPWWRDWVLAYVLIGMGFIWSSPGAGNWWVGVALMALGGAIFLAAVAHGIWTRDW